METVNSGDAWDLLDMVWCLFGLVVGGGLLHFDPLWTPRLQKHETENLFFDLSFHLHSFISIRTEAVPVAQLYVSGREKSCNPRLLPTVCRLLTRVLRILAVNNIKIL